MHKTLFLYLSAVHVEHYKMIFTKYVCTKPGLKSQVKSFYFPEGEDTFKNKCFCLFVFVFLSFLFWNIQ